MQFFVFVHFGLMWRLFSPYWFRISHSFSASGGLCYVIVAFPGHIHFNICCSLTFARCRALFVLCLVVADGSCLAPYSPLWGKGISLLRFLLIDSSWGHGQAMFYDYVTSVLILEKLA